MDNDNDAARSGGGFMAGFLMGMLAGAALAMMIVPQTGEETRDLVFGKAREAGNLAKDASGDLREKVSSIATDLQTGASGVYARGKQVIDAARSTVGAVVDEGKAAADTTKVDLSEQAVADRPPAGGI
ncbi:MAG: YtxH domain-containing protein [Candidatus Eremiobacteraeota bacterium]|nr:YtxH domain-containing protein [Candidatus Eremiobacteraeota bacterium]